MTRALQDLAFSEYLFVFQSLRHCHDVKIIYDEFALEDGKEIWKMMNI